MKDFNYNNHLKQCLELAESAAKMGEVPVGCVIVDARNKVVSTSQNLVESNNNPLSHAEVLAINLALSKLHTKYLTDCTLYVNLEPCIFCASAIMLSRIKRLVFALSDPKSGAVVSNLKIFNNNLPYPKVEVIEGIYQQQTSKLMKSFFSNLRLK